LYQRGLDLKFQVMSCDDASCSGETLVGPSNTSATYFTNVSESLNATLTPDNRWFQYKAFFSTADDSVTPHLSSVDVGYGSADTCTYSSGDWDVEASDNCTVIIATDVGGNDISITGTGSFTINGVNITNFNNLHIAGTDSSNKVNVYCLNGGCFVSFFSLLFKFFSLGVLMMGLSFLIKINAYKNV
jgi:hypothetical protein